MNTTKFQAMAYFGIGVGLIKFSLLASGWSKPSLLTFGTAFVLLALLFFCSLKLRSRWLIKVIERIQRIRLSHLSLLLILLPLAVALIQRQDIILGIVVLYIAYISYALVISKDLATVVMWLLNRKKRTNVSVS
jgi:hypothetical protein